MNMLNGASDIFDPIVTQLSNAFFSHRVSKFAG